MHKLIKFTDYIDYISPPELDWMINTDMFIIYNSMHFIQKQYYFFQSIMKSYNDIKVDIPVDMSPFEARLTPQNLKKHRMKQISQKIFSGGTQINMISIKYNATVINYKVRLSKFQFDISLHIIDRNSPHQNKKNSTNFISNGSYGIVFEVLFRDKTFAVKVQFFPNKGQNYINHYLKDIIKQVCICKICSLYGIGAVCVMNDCFDLICYKDCIQFNLQRCQQSLNINCNYNMLQKQLYQNVQILHQMRIVHKDIKPKNILYSNILQRYVFIDFGLAHCINQNIGEKTLTYREGTIGYMSKQMEMATQQKRQVDLYYNDMHCIEKSKEQYKKIYSQDKKFPKVCYLEEQFCSEQTSLNNQTIIEKVKINQNNQQSDLYEYLILKSIINTQNPYFKEFTIQFLKKNKENTRMYQILADLLYECEQYKVKDCILKKIQNQFKNDQQFLKNETIQQYIRQIQKSIEKSKNPKRKYQLSKQVKQQRNHNYRIVLGYKSQFQNYCRSLFLQNIQSCIQNAKLVNNQQQQLMQYLYKLALLQNEQQIQQILSQIQILNIDQQCQFQNIIISIYKIKKQLNLQSIFDRIKKLYLKQANNQDIIIIYSILLKKLQTIKYYKVCEFIIQQMQSISNDKLQLYYRKFSRVYKNLKKFNKAQDYAVKLLKFYKDNPQFQQTHLILKIKYQLADIYRLKTNYPKARQMINQMMHICSTQYEQDESITLIKIYNLLILIQLEVKNIKAAKQKLRLSESMMKALMKKQKEMESKYLNQFFSCQLYYKYEKYFSIFDDFIQYHRVLFNKQYGNKNSDQSLQKQKQKKMYLNKIQSYLKQIKIYSSFSKEGKILYNYQSAQFKRFEGKYDQAIKFAKCSLQESLKLDSWKLPQNYCQLMNLYRYYENNPLFPESILKIQQYLKLCMELIQKQQFFFNNSFEVIQKIICIIIYLKKYALGITFITNILNLLNNKQVSWLHGRCHTILGQLYKLQNKNISLPLAIIHLKKSIQIYQKYDYDNDGFKAKNYYYLAAVYYQQEQYIKFNQSLVRAIQLYKKVQLHENLKICTALMQRGLKQKKILSDIQEVDKIYRNAIEKDCRKPEAKNKVIKSLQECLKLYIKYYETQNHIKILRNCVEISKRCLEIDIEKAINYATKCQNIQKILKSTDPDLIKLQRQISQYKYDPKTKKYLKRVKLQFNFSF